MNFKTNLFYIVLHIFTGFYKIEKIENLKKIGALNERKKSDKVQNVKGNF